ncbi:MAG: AI-2E family transporter, partial [Clostridia bacterium]|nr:AI-2E family transporter [Clostridia bacterium]
VALLILQQIDGNFIGPKIMGNAFEIRPLLVIFAVTVGGGLFGMIGLLISVPIAVVIKMILTDYIDAKRIKNSEAQQNA